MADAYQDRNNPFLAYVFPDGSQVPVMPGKRPDYGQARWEKSGQLMWQQDPATATRWTCTWSSDMLDLRPEFKDTDNSGAGIAMIAVNRAGLFGSGAYMRVILWCQNPAVDLATIGGLTGVSFDACNGVPPDQMTNQAIAGLVEAPLFVVSPPTPITDNLLEGGRTVNLLGLAYRGAALLTFTPPGEGIRFWQVWIQLEMNVDNPGFNPDTYGFRFQASVY